MKNIEKLAPEKVVLKEIQKKRLSQLTGIGLDEMKAKTVAELDSLLKWKIDPRLFFFEKICGKVVKKDPVTGIDYPVPFATVSVEDTDCNLLWYQPSGHPWGWFFPLFCHREVIGTTQTDACGNFCVWVPRFDIDWILRWRRERICLPIAFRRPSLADLIDGVIPQPQPGPDPDPWKEIFTLSQSKLQSLAGSKTDAILKQIDSLKKSAHTGATKGDLQKLLDTRLFDHNVPPPLPKDFQKALSGVQVVASKEVSPAHAIRTSLADKLGVSAHSKELEAFNYKNFIGPFYRCFDFYVPEWQFVFDVPDITFKVTQDVNGDGIQETIYSEGYFDVRWDSGSLPFVTLQASSLAKESSFCQVPSIPCGTTPALIMAGLMPLNNDTYFNALSGYAVRPNRPRPAGVVNSIPPAGVIPNPAAETPFWGAIAFSGCVDVQNAKYYRVEQSTDDGSTFSPITNMSWNNFLPDGTSIPITADANGWYPVNPIHPGTGNPIPRNTLALPSLVFDWGTPLLQKTVLRVEIASATKVHIAYATPVAVQSDNTAPVLTCTQLSWKFTNELDSALRDLRLVDCPLIKRGAVPADIEVVFQISVQSNHLRDCGLATYGCGGGSFAAQLPAASSYHWHENVLDNSVMLLQRYRLNASSLPGCYTFACDAYDRSVSPAASHGENLLPTDWYDDNYGIHAQFLKSVAVVNENL